MSTATASKMKLNSGLLNPGSIVVVGGSGNTQKPGGKVLSNLIDGGYRGELRVVNPKQAEVQGLSCYENIDDLPATDLAILAIPAHACMQVVEKLVKEKNTRAFIILSAGFSEDGEEGRQLEQRLVNLLEEYDACLLGPNCIGLINEHYHGVFTSPVPEIQSGTCDFISSSGATAVFVMESAIPLGLKFSGIYSIGNSAHLGVEDFLEYMDVNYVKGESAPVKLLYLEQINDPARFLRHAASLVRKGCRIAAIKSGVSEAGSRAASSHTGAITSSDMAVKALFRKAGIVYCGGREELVSTACVFMHKKLKGENIAVITHAGGSAVMLTDALEKGGLKVPTLKGKDAEELKKHLNKGSSVDNPIDFLATGTAKQLEVILDYCEEKFSEIDGMVVVFGSPGLSPVNEVYQVLHEKMKSSSKPVFPVLPSLMNAREEMEEFKEMGHVYFSDEVLLGKALSKVYNTPQPEDHKEIKTKNTLVENISFDEPGEDGFLYPHDVEKLLDLVEIPRVTERVVNSVENALLAGRDLKFPLVMKVVGPLHKTDVNGVRLNISSYEELEKNYEDLMKIKGAVGVMLQPMMKGTELFIGVKKEPGFGHLILFGLGGVLVEVIKDVSTGLVPLTKKEAKSMIRSLQGYPILKGIRGKPPVDENKLCEILQKVSVLCQSYPGISEMDINPLMAQGDLIYVVDARIRLSTHDKRDEAKQLG